MNGGGDSLWKDLAADKKADDAQAWVDTMAPAVAKLADAQADDAQAEVDAAAAAAAATSFAGALGAAGLSAAGLLASSLGATTTPPVTRASSPGATTTPPITGASSPGATTTPPANPGGGSSNSWATGTPISALDFSNMTSYTAQWRVVMVSTYDARELLVKDKKIIQVLAPDTSRTWRATYPNSIVIFLPESTNGAM